MFSGNLEKFSRTFMDYNIIKILWTRIRTSGTQTKNLENTV